MISPEEILNSAPIKAEEEALDNYLLRYYDGNKLNYTGKLSTPTIRAYQKAGWIFTPYSGGGREEATYYTISHKPKYEPTAHDHNNK